jgi:hypothetical protein
MFLPRVFWFQGDGASVPRVTRTRVGDEGGAGGAEGGVLRTVMVIFFVSFSPMTTCVVLTGTLAKIYIKTVTKLI